MLRGILGEHPSGDALVAACSEKAKPGAGGRNFGITGDLARETPVALTGSAAPSRAVSASAQ
jgi:hypothetical protein